MEPKNSSFILFTKINEVVKELTNEQKGLLFQAILDYLFQQILMYVKVNYHMDNF